MRPAGLLRIGITGVGIAALAGLLTVGDAADARPRFGPGAVFGILRAPLGMLGVGHLRARHAYAQRHRAARGIASARRSPVMAAGAGAAAAAAYAQNARQPSWSGPVFWPAAYDDMFGYVARPDDLRFWSGGFADVMAGIFGQAGSEERGSPRARMRGVSTASAETTGAGAATAQKACGTLTAQSVDDLMNQIDQTIHPRDKQQAAVKELRAAMTRAADDLRSACPQDTPLTPLARLDAMQQRLWAMQSAALNIRTPFAKLVAALDDDQKTRLDASATPQAQAQTQAPPERHANMRRHRRHAHQDREASRASGGAAGNAGPIQICYMQSQAAGNRPSEQIAERVRPTDEQQASLKDLAETSGNMTKLMLASCPDKPPANALARLDAVLGRLEAMLYAINVVNPPLQNFYGSLTDEQKARFNSLGAAAS
jgi:hypothetical protein